MSGDCLEKCIASYMQTEQRVYSFGWQGGEPSLMGLGFFQQAVTLQQQYGRSGAVISNGFQTNGTMLSGSLAEFFTQYKFLVGLSLDGPEHIHNRYRRTIGGRGSFKNAMGGIKTLRRRQGEFNILTLVSEANVHHAGEVYDFLRNEDLRYHQYIPCVEFDSQGKRQPWAITGEDWGRFLLELFSRWYPRDIRRVSIRLFDSILNYLVYGQHNVCSMGNSCDHYFLVEHTGDIYPCDFFVDSELKLGNIQTDSWQTLRASPAYGEFAARKQILHTPCSDCELCTYCGGDCPKYRTRDGRSFLCEGWKLFYAETLPVFRDLAKQLTAQPHT